MKALTIRQPWATLTFLVDQAGKPLKQVETRTRNTNYRGRVAIHAGVRLAEAGIIQGPSGAVFAEVDANYPGGDHLFYTLARHYENIGAIKLIYGAVIGEVTILDSVPLAELEGTPLCTERERAFGDWSEGRWGWVLGDPVLYEKPVPAKGQLGLWNWKGV